MKTRFVPMFSVAAILGMTAPPAAGKTVAVTGDYQATVVAVGKCAFTKSADADKPGQDKILGAIAAAVISKGVNLIASAAAAAGEAKTWTVTAGRNFEAKANAFPSCVQVVRGALWKVHHDDSAPLPGGLEPARAALEANGIYLAATPEFFFEGKIVGSTDKSALAIRPIASYLGKPIGGRLLRPGEERSVALFFAITAPGTKPTLETAPAASLIMGKIEPNLLKLYPDPDAATGQSSPLESAWFTLSMPQATKPMTMTALESETQDGSQFWKFVGSVLGDDGVKSKATAELQQAFIPAVAAKAEADDRASLSTLRGAAETGYATALGKLNACVAATADAVQAGADAKKALRDYILADAALPAGDALKSGSLTLDVLEGPNGIDLTKPATISQSCSAIRSNYMVRTN